MNTTVTFPTATEGDYCIPEAHFADDLVNPPELGILEREIRRVPRGAAVVIPASAATYGHRGHSWPILWKQHLAQLLQHNRQSIQ